MSIDQIENIKQLVYKLNQLKDVIPENIFSDLN